MSGHSKWHQIKHKKSAADNKRGQEFTRLAKQISVAARSNPNPIQNPALREAIAKAKQANMPQENIDKLLTKNSNTPLQAVVYEAFGPGGVALLVIAATDNPKRTVAEVRHLLNQHNITLSGPNSVLWKFTQTATDQYTPQFTVDAAVEHRSKIISLTNNLLEHPDVRFVFNDLSP